MDIRPALFARADAHVNLQALIGDPPRLYPVEAPQKAIVPYVTYQVVSAARDHAMGADGLGTPRVQFDCWGATRAEAMSVRDQILACFDRMPQGTYGGVFVDSAYCVNDGIDVERDEVSLIPRVTVELMMAYRLV